MEAATIAGRLGEFAADTRLADLPTDVVDLACHLVLDAVGVAYCAADEPFADKARQALGSLDSGGQPVLALPDRLAARDAALLGGILIHGHDFDDTHIGSIVHVSASALPAALAAAISAGRSGSELLLAYALGIEVSARVGLAAHGGFHAAGFHPTGVAGAFGSAVAAAKLAGLDARGIAAAQQIVGSSASGILEFLADGAWTKRLHPGWAASNALTATAFAATGWPGATEVYEGRYGLYATHLGGREWDPSALTDGLGARWELRNTGVKPYPSCHFSHAFADAILALCAREQITAADVARIECLIHPTAAAAVFEPLERKRRPGNLYDAKFSVPYVIGACLSRGQLTLAEFTEDSLADPRIHAVADQVSFRDDPDTRFPDAYSAAIEVTLHDGRRLSHREEVNRGHPERPLSHQDIREKFESNMRLAADVETTDRVRAAVLGLGAGAGSALDFGIACAR
ncbi:2-methylcitrate dehydratase PrpD [Tamaricihabitans halophyticus]|uniref:2-methylcitrate dehydratase PrpD n=1 Tax=Tamaricihabitans halophyticus TaxID=1262583 RepID=A0A4R2QVH1_9PSEU|nr:MmgE/PrpD family protein [Tamaricihabitans halophyticus]TCP53079.1 2-methylcitrate dehydratase PrpD [Tamaricihabitans halophyticus]